MASIWYVESPFEDQKKDSALVQEKRELLSLGSSSATVI